MVVIAHRFIKRDLVPFNQWLDMKFSVCMETVAEVDIAVNDETFLSTLPTAMLLDEDMLSV